jgi:hypothetical protein
MNPRVCVSQSITPERVTEVKITWTITLTEYLNAGRSKDTRKIEVEEAFLNNHDFDNVGALRVHGKLDRDYTVREFTARDGSTIELLEIFDPMTGFIIEAFWQTTKS